MTSRRSRSTPTGRSTHRARCWGACRSSTATRIYSGQRRIFLAPSLTWKPDDRTALKLVGRYVDDHINSLSPTTAYGTALPNPNGPISRRLSINDGEHPAVQNNDYWNVGYVFDHKFSENIAVHQSLRYQNFHNNWDNWLFITGISAERPTVTRAFYGPYDQHGKYFRVDTNASERFDTGPLNHYLLLGVDYGRRSGMTPICMTPACPIR